MGVGLRDVEDILSPAVNVGAAAAHISVPADIAKAMFHILEAAPCVDKHQVSVCARLGNCTGCIVWNAAVNLRSQCPVYIKKAIFLVM